jgi:hypothetical protein
VWNVFSLTNAHHAEIAEPHPSTTSLHHISGRSPVENKFGKNGKLFLSCLLGKNGKLFLSCIRVICLRLFQL